MGYSDNIGNKFLHVFTLPTTAEAFFDGQFEFLVNNGHNITVAANAPILPKFCERNHIKNISLPIKRKISLFDDIKCIFAARKIIKKGKYDTVVGHTPKGALIAMTASMLAGTKNRVYFRHGLIYTTAHGTMRWVLKTVERITALFSTLIINVSPSLGELAIRDYLNPASKQRVIGIGSCGGIDTQILFNPETIKADKVTALKKRLNISDKDFIIGFCGRLCRDKGIIELIEGFEKFKENNPNISAKLLLIGRFDTRDALPSFYQNKIKNTPDIIFTDYVEHDLLPMFYSIMDVFVFPSHREGFGMSVIEASAMEIPILVSRSHGCVDTIREHQTGEYIELTPESICNGLEIMMDTHYRQKLGKTGRNFILENFDYSVMWPKVLDTYNEILK